eukprot:990531_1
MQPRISSKTESAQSAQPQTVENQAEAVTLRCDINRNRNKQNIGDDIHSSANINSQFKTQPNTKNDALDMILMSQSNPPNSLSQRTSDGQLALILPTQQISRNNQYHLTVFDD